MTFVYLCVYVYAFNANTPKIEAGESLSVPGQQDSLVNILRSGSAGLNSE